MAELYTYNGTHLVTIRDGTVEFTESAESGGDERGRLAIDDTAGTLTLVGQKNLVVAQSSAASNSTLFRGFIGDRTYGRDAGTERKPHTGTARGIGVEVHGLNSMLGFRLVQAQLPDVTVVQGGRRPAETVAARMSWILGSSFLSGLVANNGRVATSTADMDKADYRNQFPGDVIGDCAFAAGGWNHYVRDFGSGPELVFRNDNTSTADTSALRISNVTADIDSDHATLGATKTFGPSKDATLTRRPGNVISKGAVSHRKGTVIRRRAATETTFNGERAGVISSGNIETVAQATALADSTLHQRSTEEDTITCSILVPDSAVDLLCKGDRVSAKFQHFTPEGYGEFTWFRVLERTVRSMNAEAAFYELDLKLSPQEEADVPGDCVDLWDNTPSGSYFPLGEFSPTGPVPNPSDGVVQYWRGGLEVPSTPDEEGRTGGWGFADYGAGGTGTIDYAGDCWGNRLYFILVGNGTFSVQTEIYGGSSRFLQLFRDGVLLDSGFSGVTLDYEITDATDGDCISVLYVKDNGGICGGKWGWSEMVWTAA